MYFNVVRDLRRHQLPFYFIVTTSINFFTTILSAVKSSIPLTIGGVQRGTFIKSRRRQQRMPSLRKS